LPNNPMVNLDFSLYSVSSSILKW